MKLITKNLKSLRSVLRTVGIGTSISVNLALMAVGMKNAVVIIRFMIIVIIPFLIFGIGAITEKSISSPEGDPSNTGESH